MIRLHTIGDVNFGHLAEKSVITPRGKFMKNMKESEKYPVCLSQILFSSFHPLRWKQPKKSLVVARSELETKVLLVQHVLATMRWNVTLARRTALHVASYSWHLRFPSSNNMLVLRRYVPRYSFTRMKCKAMKHSY